MMKWRAYNEPLSAQCWRQTKTPYDAAVVGSESYASRDDDYRESEMSRSQPSSQYPHR